MYLSFANIQILWGYTYGQNMPDDLPFYDAMETLLRFHGDTAMLQYGKSVQAQL